MTIYTGASGADSFNGTSGADSFYGGDGNDYLLGRAGNDYFEDGKDADHVYGGKGNDTFNNVSGGQDHWFGGKGNDLLITNVIGLDANGFVVGFNAKTGVHGRLNSTLGQDEISSIEKFTVLGDWDCHVTGDGAQNVFTTGAGQDTLFGGGGNDKLIGNGNQDKLYGGKGRDDLFGGAGRDVLRGGAGSDDIYGGKGNDVLFGGAGADTFHFGQVSHSTTAKSDVIRDFNTLEDRIELGNFANPLIYIGADAFSNTAGEFRATVNGAGNTILRMDVDGDGSADFKIVLEDVDNFSAENFLLFEI